MGAHGVRVACGAADGARWVGRAEGATAAPAAGPAPRAVGQKAYLRLAAADLRAARGGAQLGPMGWCTWLHFVSRDGVT